MMVYQCRNRLLRQIILQPNKAFFLQIIIHVT